MTPSEVAAWMLAEVERDGVLYQDEAVYEIERRFGEKFTYTNDRGNPAIRQDVLAAFRIVSEDTVVWERGERLWRKREKPDEPGRQQQ